MHVLHILEATQGGTRRHVLDLLPALQARGVSCTLLGSPVRNAQFDADAHSLRQHGIEVQAVPMERGFYAAGDWRAIATIGAALRESRPDIIHCHSTKAGVLGRLARLRYAPRTPLVYTPHCIAFDTGLPQGGRRAARIFEKALAPATSHFIAVSAHERRAIISRGLCEPERVTTIHNGIDLQAFDTLPARLRAEFGMAHTDFVIGCFGRLTRQKNQEALLRFLPAAAERIPSVRLFLVGGGEDEPALRALARALRIEAHIVWAGEQHEARALYKLCDIVVQPSRWEGCPYSILEAMAARRLVFARSVGGVPEILGERYGIAYAPPGVYAQAGSGARNEHLDLIVSLAAAGDPAASRETADWRALTEAAARERVESNFKLERMVDKTMAVYESL